jgi:hypothetical protein
MYFSCWGLAGLLGAREAIRESRDHRTLLFFFGVFILGALGIARAGDFMENAYQIAFNGFMAAMLLLLIWVILAAARQPRVIWIWLAIHLGSFLLYKFREGPEAFSNRYAQNAGSIYGGRPYSPAYLEEVIHFFKKEKPLYGGYLADSAFYRDLYYSRRNPNVYHLPLTYIISNQVPTNMDFCLSTRAAIVYSGEGHPLRNHFLDLAISRSLFYRDYPDSTGKAVADFIRDQGLRYLILSPGAGLDPAWAAKVTRQLLDPGTGERFLILQAPAISGTRAVVNE